MNGLAPFQNLRRFFRDLGVAFLGCLFTLVFLFQPFKVEGTSMMPVLCDQQRILVNKFVYGISAIQRGDVIVFRYPRDPSKSFIKRVIGVPGDIVELRRGHLRVNGRFLDETYLRPDLCGSDLYGPEVVADGSYFVLGDHRLVSNDSRDWGLVPRELIYGKAVLRYWPPKNFGLLD